MFLIASFGPSFSICIALVLRSHDRIPASRPRELYGFCVVMFTFYHVSEVASPCKHTLTHVHICTELFSAAGLQK